MEIFYRILRKMKNLWSKNELKYELIPYGENFTLIRLNTDPYKNVVYGYGSVSFTEIQNSLVLKFNYEIVDSAGHDIEALQNDQKFDTMLGDILTSLLQQEGNYGTVRKDDFEESDLQ